MRIWEDFGVGCCGLMAGDDGMGNRGEESHDSERDVMVESLVLQELRHRLLEPGPWPQRFRRLAEAIAQAPILRVGSVQELSCEECEGLLDLYVDGELQGCPVQQVYPLIWRHLGICPHCREAHDLLADILDLERRGELPAIPNWSPIMCLDIKPHGSDPGSALRSRRDRRGGSGGGNGRAESEGALSVQGCMGARE